MASKVIDVKCFFHFKEHELLINRAERSIKLSCQDLESNFQTRLLGQMGFIMEEFVK